MSTHRFIVEVEVVDELLEEWDGEAKPPPNDVANWENDDLFLAYSEGLIDPGESVLTYDGPVKATA